MKLKDYDYNLPEELIAQYRKDNRDESRLLVLDSHGGMIDSNFYNLPEFLNSGDLVVLNNSKVIKARIRLTKKDSAININLDKPLTDNIWSAFAKPAKKLDAGDSFDFDGNNIIVKEKHENGQIELEFALKSGINVFDFLEVYGTTPIPPYIRKGEAEGIDDDTYQTIFSEEKGSVAAPTAGLHFTDDIFVQLNKKNIDFCFVTLHVGAGTFLPVKTENIDDHVMHSEYGFIPEETADKINKAKKEGRNIIAVGTTAARTLEHSASSNGGKVMPESFETNLYIKPGFDFKIVDRLITNFHQPKSTLMMLVSAFAGYENIIKAYHHAIEKNYRFLSYGDAMLISKSNKRKDNK